MSTSSNATTPSVNGSLVTRWEASALSSMKDARLTSIEDKTSHLNALYVPTERARALIEWLDTNPVSRYRSACLANCSVYRMT
jgi:hypothetical protein